MVINKKLLQTIAALWILIFHLWINLTNTTAELFLIRIGYVGVDLFFFLSAYSMTDRQIDYRAFLKNRFVQVYLKFVIFTVFTAVIRNWSMLRAIQILSGYELFNRGAGAFLWFIPAIMLFYILAPLWLKWKQNYKIQITLVIWFLCSILLEYVFHYQSIFAFTNRIPVMLLGYTLKKRKMPVYAGVLCLTIGFLLLYQYGFTRKLNVPLQEFYYLFGAILCAGLACLSGSVKTCRIVELISSTTLELYALQMILGADLVTMLYRMTADKLLTNLSVILIMIGAAQLCSWIFNLVRKKCSH